MNRMARWLRIPLLALPLLAPLPAKAEDEPLLEDPVGLIGVAPVPVRGFSLTLTGAYDRARNGANRDTWLGGFEAEAGLVPGLDLRFSQAGAYGQGAPSPADPTMRAWGGASRIGLRWQLVEEVGPWPALGVFGAIGIAYGEGSRPAEAAEITALASRTVVGGPRPVALLFNIGWAERLSPEPGERPGRYQLAAGVAHALAQDSSVALSYARNQGDRGERDENLVQVGLWHRLSRGGPILGVAAGVGIGRDSPAMQAGLSLKWLLGAAAD